MIPEFRAARHHELVSSAGPRDRQTGHWRLSPGLETCCQDGFANPDARRGQVVSKAGFVWFRSAVVGNTGPPTGSRSSEFAKLQISTSVEKPLDFVRCR